MSMKEVMQINSNFYLPIDNLITNLGLGFGFGDGHHGVVTCNNTFPITKKADADRYEIHSTYFEVPAGVTLRPPKRSTGLVIYSLSDIVINGTIDMKSRGYHYDGSSVLKKMTVMGQDFLLGIGGATVASAQSGKGNALIFSTQSGGGADGSTGEIKFLTGCFSAGGYSPPRRGRGGVFYTHNNTASKGGLDTSASDEPHRQPTGVVILVARGKIILRGKIDCSGSPGIAADSGTGGYVDSEMTYMVCGGRGGNGAQSPSGGGSITMIAKQIDRTGGTLDVSGKSYTNTTKGNSPSGTMTFTVPNRGTATAFYGTGGTGTPAAGYTSQAGTINQYIYEER